jgi:hypothetical protein
MGPESRDGIHPDLKPALTVAEQGRERVRECQQLFGHATSTERWRSHGIFNLRQSARGSLHD